LKIYRITRCSEQPLQYKIEAWFNQSQFLANNLIFALHRQVSDATKFVQTKILTMSSLERG